ncbi:hypothetical protein HYG81_06220 [Natrinema zhouii]|uniref:Uncharacterized protein n=1 Tax=Natrinema zhouii TaxID=1710539 RepID=A0A7D6CR67_9EURY|nr:hypothetical protein [Natrinema zhouii]QLK27196.1 hypothetical protein HYG81_06220 [Natrinema zhouii]
MVRTDTTSARDRTRSKGGLSFEHNVTGDDGQRRITIHQDVDPADGSRITTAEPDVDTLAYDARPTAPHIPGSGERYDTCGDPFHGLFCPDCAATQEVGQTCQRSRCERCYKSWCFRRAKTQVAKLESLRHDLEQRESGWQKFHHLTVSFRPDVRVRSDDPVKQLRKITQALLDQIGVEHGLAVFHNYRIKPEYCGDVFGHESGDGDLNWCNILSEKLESEEWPAAAVYDEFLEYAPHFHVFAVADFVQCGAVTKQIADDTGVVIHRISDDDGKSLETIEDLAAATMYALSHVGLKQRGNSYRACYQAFGRLANHAAEDWALAKADDACRETASDVLGLSLAKPECDAHIEPATDNEDMVTPDDTDDPIEAMNSSGLGPTTATSSLRSSTASAGTGHRTDTSRPFAAGGDQTGLLSDVPDWINEPICGETLTQSTERCGTTMRPIRCAGEYLESVDWCETIDEGRLDGLKDAYTEYQDLGKPEPVDDPPPTDVDTDAPVAD